MSGPVNELSLQYARNLDATDPLRAFRDEFALPAGVIYLDGNSLGALPHATARRMAQVISDEWGKDIIRSWMLHGWFESPTRVGDKIARLIGAAAGEVIVTDSTSVNLYKCVGAALQLAGDRSVVLSESGNFPTDLYIIQGVERMLGDRAQLRVADREKILDSIDASVAVVVLTHVHYKTAYQHDMVAITRRAHEQGALVIWDLSHSAGAVEVDLNAAGVDFAVGCGYKYLNGSPGCPAYIFVAKRHQTRAVSPLTGWLGHARPFDFSDEYEPAAGISRFLCGSHQVFGILALETGVDIALRAEPRRLWEKSRGLTGLFIRLVETTCCEFGVEVVGPRGSDRGSHVSVRHPQGYAVVQCLIAEGVVGDFRAPDLMRFGFTPLYVSYEDVWNAAAKLRAILRDGRWNQPQFLRRQKVT